MSQRIRIKLKSYDYNLVDKSAEKIVRTVKATGAEKVHVTHGQTAVFSKYLNELGIDADEVKTNYGDEETEEKEILEGNK